MLPSDKYVLGHREDSRFVPPTPNIFEESLLIEKWNRSELQSIK